MKKQFVFLNNYLKYKVQKTNYSKDNIRDYLKDREYIPGHKVISPKAVNELITDMILGRTPFMVGRFGATELFTVRSIDFCVRSLIKKSLKQLCLWSGFFPATFECGCRFKDLMLESVPSADVMGVWGQPFEDYYLKKYGGDDLLLTYLLDLEPWSCPESPWTAALEGKKVLVIHPFTETIKRQYARRNEIFPGTNILPEFDLYTVKAVQTIAGEVDSRFGDWFEALEWTYQEALKIDFDVAIIGCGAYGFPLAAKLKRAGKQVIHLAGATQLLFGIKGKRWDNDPTVSKLYNSSWVRPLPSETPLKSYLVEGGCYW